MEADGRDWTHLSQVHFGAAALGDARRSRRLVKTAELIFKSPAGSLPVSSPVTTIWMSMEGNCPLRRKELAMVPPFLTSSTVRRSTAAMMQLPAALAVISRASRTGTLLLIRVARVRQTLARTALRISGPKIGRRS